MRVVSYGKTFVDGVTVDSKLTQGQLGICSSDGTAVATTGRPQSFVVMSVIPTKAGGEAIQRGVDINPYNFHYEVRKYTGADTKAKIVVKGITNPALKPAQGVVYPADAEFVGAIEVISSRPYRAGLVENPNPQILTIPVKMRATDSLDQIVEKIKKGIFLTTYNKELFTVDVVKSANGIDVTFEAVRETSLTINLFGVIKDQESTGVVTVEKTKLSGFLNCVADSDEDLRYSLINMGWNPNDEWQGKAWGLGDAKEGLNKVGYCVISTTEFNQFPEIAADRNSPRKFQIVVMPNAELDKFIAKLNAIKALADGTHDNGIEVNTNAD